MPPESGMYSSGGGSGSWGGEPYRVDGSQSPDSMRRLASAYPASKRLWKPIWSVAPESSTS